MADLKLWHDGYDWVIAESREEAARLSSGHTGETDSILAEAIEAYAEWTKPTLTITPDEGETREEKTVAEWIAEKGRGFLCSTEY